MQDQETVKEPSGPSWASWGRVLLFTLGLVVVDNLFGVSRLLPDVKGMLSGNIILAGVYGGIGVFLTGICVLLLRTRSRWVLGLVLALFIFSTALELQYKRLNSRGLEPTLVAIAIKEISFIGEAVDSYVDTRAVLSFAGITVFWLACAWVLRRKRTFGKLLGGRATAVLLLVVIVSSLGLYARFKTFRVYPTPTRLVHNVVEFLIQDALVEPRVDVEVKLVERPFVTQRVVLIVDESVRPDQLSTGGSLETTPYLRSVQDRFVDFGTAAAGSTCSHHSNILLNSFVRPADVGNRAAIEQAQTIFYYAKKAGWRTALLMGQYRSPLHNGIRESDLQHIDEVVIASNLDRGPEHRNDYLMLEELEKLYAKYPDEQLFVFMLKLGCHFPYDNCYPEEEAVFKPVLGESALASENIERVMNSYHNALRYSVDGFHRELHRRLDRHDALYIYTSDHGQVFDFKGIGLTHCGGDRMMAAVPLWLDAGGGALERLQQRHGKDFARRNLDHASHFNIFPTLLDLMNVATDEPTLFDDLSEQKRIYCPPSGGFEYERRKFDTD